MRSLWRRSRAPDSESVEARAREAERVGDWEKARALWHEQRALAPEALPGWIGEATALGHLGRPGDAARLLEQAPQSVTEQVEVAVLHAAFGAVDGADLSIERWRSITRRFPFVAFGFVSVVKLLMAAGRLEEAETMIDHGLKAHPCELTLLTDGVTCAMRTENWPLASARLSRIEFAMRAEPFTREVAPALRRTIDQALEDRRWEPARARARTAERDGHWSAAAELWTELEERGDRSPETVESGARCRQIAATA